MTALSTLPVTLSSADDRITLTDGNAIPCIGYGTWRVKDRENGAAICLEAARAGYRHFDTASLYGSEGSVGDAIRASGVAREEFFVTTKVWKDDLSEKAARASLVKSLSTMQLDYVDLLLIHWPRHDAEDAAWRERLAETWNAFSLFKKEGLVRSIGVANFLPHHFEAIAGGEKPVVDQIEVHPGYLQAETIEYCRANGILVEAWAPLGQKRLIEHPVVLQIADKHGVSTAQVLLRFSLQLGILPLPKSADPVRMRQNRNVFGFSLDPVDMELLLAVEEKTGWSGEHPDDAIPMPDLSKL